MVARMPCPVSLSAKPIRRSALFKVFSLMRLLKSLRWVSKCRCAGTTRSSSRFTTSIAWTDNGTMYGGTLETLLRLLRILSCNCLTTSGGMTHSRRSKSNWSGVARRSSPVRTPVSNRSQIPRRVC
ncbi:hypothetical protein D3C81_1648950 [compost metagenome]